MRNDNVSTIHKCSWVAQHTLVSLYVYIASMTLVLFLFEHIVHMNYLLCNISCSPFNLAFVLAAQHKQHGIII